MARRQIMVHALLVLATLAGIVGMGIVFRGAMEGNWLAISRGAPLLLLGLWWAGRELGRSMLLHKTPRK